MPHTRLRAMERRTLGTGGPSVSAQGLGCMGMSANYGSTDETRALATIDRALELGCRHVAIFGMGADSGHHEHRRPSTRVATEARG